MKTNRLAEIFEGWRQVIESAESPFSKLAIFVLPIIAPIVPASFTGLHMYQLLLQIFGEERKVLSGLLALTVAIVLELLGYVGAITFIKSVFDLVRKGRDEYLVPVTINFMAYVFYLALMFMVNIKLGEYFQTPKIINSIIGWLSFITVPTGLLAANYLSSKEHKEEDREARNASNEFRLKKKALEKGMNIFAAPVTYQTEVKQEESGDGDWRTYTPEQQYEIKYVLTPSQIMSKYRVKRSTAYAYKTSKYDIEK